VAVEYIVDKSAFARVSHGAVARRLAPLFMSGDVASCAVIDLEILYSARNHAELVRIRDERAALPQLSIEQADFERAIQVLEGLARTGHHRAAGIPDLLIAAVAERAGLTVLHYDKDFDVIAGFTKQRVEWIVPAGSVP
jgi:predicted nucleic acid-binding protein